MSRRNVRVTKRNEARFALLTPIMNSELLLDSLQVKGFRAFEDLQIPKLGRVNLITGKNNVGKTCLLEALQVYARRGEPNVLQSLLVRRDETYHSNNMKQEESAKFLNDIRHVFYDRPTLDSMSCHMEVGALRDDGNRVAIYLEPEESHGAQETTLELPFLEDTATHTTIATTTENRGFAKIPAWLMRGELRNAYIAGNSVRSLFLRIGTRTIQVPFIPGCFRPRFISGLSEEALPHTFIWTRGLDNTTLSHWWDRVALTSLEDDVIAALQMLVPSVVRVNFVSAREGNPERIPVVRVTSRDFPIPMKSLGEGVNRMFGLVLALVSSSNGFLMVDEIETGLHYSVQIDMWRLVFKVARQLNVQVFATTHSSDCIRAFEQAAREDKEEEGILIRLEEKQGKIRAVTFDERKLEIAAREDIEVR